MSSNERKNAVARFRRAVKAVNDEQRNAIVLLRRALNNEQTVYTSMLKRSRTGLRRCFAVYAAGNGRTIRDITGLVAKALGRKLAMGLHAIPVSGCGFDGGHEIVSDIATVTRRKLRHDTL